MHLVKQLKDLILSYFTNVNLINDIVNIYNEHNYHQAAYSDCPSNWINMQKYIESNNQTLKTLGLQSYHQIIKIDYNGIPLIDPKLIFIDKYLNKIQTQAFIDFIVDKRGSIVDPIVIAIVNGIKSYNLNTIYRVTIKDISKNRYI
jgi:hypothetical protein